MSEEGIKHDDGKLPLDLLPIEALEEVSRVLRHGAAKYGVHNWRKGMAWSRLIAAALRHIFAWVRGERIDKESGESHLAHACCALLFLLSYEQWGIGNDDLPIATPWELKR